MKAAAAREITNQVIQDSYSKLPDRIKTCAGMGQPYIWTDIPLTIDQDLEMQQLGYTVEWNETVNQHKISW